LPRNWQRRYNLLLLAEFALIFLSSLALRRTGHPELIPPVFCLIVGLNFFPLAGIFDMKPYRWTAIALCVIAIIGFALLGPIGPAKVRVVVGPGAATLWASAIGVAQRPAHA
jgi:hypothetical protein